jgi:hypothetical protein
MASACTIVIDRLDDGRSCATCPNFPDLEVIADSEEAVRAGMEAAIEVVLRRRLGEEETARHEPR